MRVEIEFLQTPVCLRLGQTFRNLDSDFANFAQIAFGKWVTKFMRVMQE